MIKKQEMLFMDVFPEFKVTSELKKNVTKHPSNLSYRIRIGMFRTDEEKLQYIKTSLSRSLPSIKQKLSSVKIKSKHL